MSGGCYCCPMPVAAHLKAPFCARHTLHRLKEMHSSGVLAEMDSRAQAQASNSCCAIS